MQDNEFQLLAKAFVGILDGHTQMVQKHEAMAAGHKAMAGQMGEVLGILERLGDNSVPLRKDVEDLKRRVEALEEAS